MFSVTVRDHVMIAHSLRGEAFGPAQNLHGATYVADVRFERPSLDSNDIVVDIGAATDTVHGLCAKINYRNLDELDMFGDRRSTTERIAQWLCQEVIAAIKAGDLGAEATGISKVGVSLQESHVAWAAYEETLTAPDSAS
ncbi:MAG: 6-pyruvoyl trahydropterin synthase family protein [Rhodospirillaceae bacterium]